MTTTLPAVINPFVPFVGLTGTGLNSGSLKIGVAGSDPDSSPQACYWDAAGTIPATQPIDIEGGYPMRSGTPAQLFTASTYSMRLRDHYGVQVFYVANANPAPAPAGNVVYVDDYGAHAGDLATDSWAAFNYCVNNFPVVRWRGYSYRLSQGLVIPSGCDAGGTAFLPNQVTNMGSTLVFDLGVAIGVQLLATQSLGTARLSNTTITRAAGAIPAGSIGLKVNTGYNMPLENVNVTRNAINFQWLSVAPNGISSKGRGIYSGTCTDAHVEVNGWPELHIDQGRLGSNGGLDVNCTAYVRITGGGTGGSGPNGVFFNQVQMNQGVNAPSYGLQFVNMSHTDSNALEFKFNDCHIEGVSSAVVKSDASCVFLNRFTLEGLTVNCPGTPMWALDPGTQPSDWEISDNEFYVSTFVLAPTAAFSKVSISGNKIKCAGSITAPVNSTFNLANNAWDSLTIAGAGNFVILGDRFSAGVLTNNATGKVTYINPESSLFAWTPQLNFGGAHVGMTTSVAIGTWQCVGSYVTASFRIILTNKGSSTGQATITGLPVQVNATEGQAGVATLYATNLASMSGPLVAECGASSNLMNLYNGSAAGVLFTTEANYTNTSVIYGTVTYQI